MKASEVIKELQKLIEQHGDLPCYTWHYKEKEKLNLVDNIEFENSTIFLSSDQEAGFHLY